MSLLRFSFAAALLGSAIALAAPAPAPASGPAVSFEPFRSIGSLNIFNSYRVGPVSEAQQPQVDTIALVGTLQDERDHLAFFDSSDRNYRKALHAGDSIAGYTVARIDVAGVELTHDGKSIPLRMGQQLRRPPGGEWSVSSAPREFSTAEVAAPGAAAPAIPADASETLKRLMEQRQKQLKQ
jgi:hypothetical protein